jgi:hypothetical protein
MNPQNLSTSWKTVATGLALVAAVGSVAYLGLNTGRDSDGKTTPALEGGTAPSPALGLALGDSQGPGSAPINGNPSSAVSHRLEPATKILFSQKGSAEGAPLVSAGINPAADKGRVLRLSPAAFVNWAKVGRGERVVLPTLNGDELFGTVTVVSSDPGWYRFGGTLDGDKGTFQLNASSDQVHGGIYFPDLGVGYQIQMDEQEVVLVERRLEALVCYPGIKSETQGGQRLGSGVAPATGPQVIPQINTRPGARGVIFVDFAGGVISSASWVVSPVTALPSTLSGDSISQVMERAAGAFAPFDVTLTTIRSVYNAAPIGRRMRAVVTPTDAAGPGTGGVAFMNSWKWGGADMVCWVFNQGVKTCADTIAHEVGHTLGLSHHGTQSGGREYYGGHGGGVGVPTSWGPIMGAPFSVNLTQWSRGEYFDANNKLQDDLSIIVPGNNFGTVSLAGAGGSVRALPLNGTLFQASGTLVSQLDSHVYQFSTTGGKISASVRPASAVGTGDFRLDLLNGDGAAVVVADPTDTLGASVSQTLIPGVYRLRVTPSGTGPVPVGGYKTGYSPYGSLGGYTMTGVVESANNLPAFLNSKLISATEEKPLTVAFEVTDPANTTVSVLSQKLPPGAPSFTLTAGSGSFGEATKMVLSGTPAKGASDGVWSLTLLAKSKVGETRMEFNLVVSPQSQPLSSALGSAVTNVSTLATSPWIGVTGTLATGTSGVIAQSGATPDRGTSLIRCDYTAPSEARGSWSVMTFFWQSDTEPGKDIVQCRVDGVLAKDMLTGQPLALSGKRGWVKQTVLLSATGTRRIEFAYTKDANLRSDVDRVWLYGIEIGQPPAIRTSPVASLRVVPGSKVGSDRFSLSAEASGATAVAWWKDGVLLTNGTSKSGSVVSGVNTGTLTVTGVSAADAGVYWMVARNAWGAAVSSRSDVVVWVPPVVTSQPVAPLGLRIGDPLILTAEVRGARPMYYQWRKDGVPGRWSSTPSLTINRTTASSAGKYVLVAVNPSGTVSSAEVTVSFSQTTARNSAPAK